MRPMVRTTALSICTNEVSVVSTCGRPGAASWNL